MITRVMCCTRELSTYTRRHPQKPAAGPRILFESQSSYGVRNCDDRLCRGSSRLFFSIVLERPALICKGLPPAGRHSLETLDDSIPRHKRRGLRAPARRMIPCRTSNIASCLSQYLIQSCNKHILLYSVRHPVDYFHIPATISSHIHLHPKMTASKFIEVLDDAPAPSFPQANVSLEDVLAETRRRSSSATSMFSTDGATSPVGSSPPASPIAVGMTLPPSSPIKTRRRGFSILKNKT